MSIVPVSSGQRFVLGGVDWRAYTHFLRAFDGRPSVRLTFDRGALEIMTLTPEHEGDAYFLGRLIDVLTEELGLPVKAGGSATFRRRRKQRGLEPDNSYWIANEPRVRGKRRIDLRVDPPPDLAVEVDITHSSLKRLPIYAALKVPEVWRLAEDGTLFFHVLAANGRYTESPDSRSFSGLTPTELLPFMAARAHQDENAVIRQLRPWVRQRFVPGHP